MSQVKKISQTLFITPTTEKANELLYEFYSQYDFLKVITLSHLMQEIFEVYDDSSILLDVHTMNSLIYSLVEKQKSKYFSYLNAESESINLLSKYFIKLQSNEVSIKDFNYEEKKQDALEELLALYINYKQKNNLVDKSDIEKMAYDKIEEYLSHYDEIFLDVFEISEIKLYASQTEKKILDKMKAFSNATQLKPTLKETKTNLYKQSAFNSYDEVRVAIKLAKHLLLEKKCTENEIVIVTSDFNEYAPYFKNLLSEYGMKGYDTIGESLSSFSTKKHALKNHSHDNVVKAYWDYENSLSKVKALSKKLKLSYNSDSLSSKILEQSMVRSKKEGVLFTDLNKLIGLKKSYKHIIFVGTDITHFPPKSRDNFLFSQKNAEELFCTNNVFLASKVLYSEIKRLSENLYVVMASYKGKRTLSPSILIDKDIEKSIDLSNVASRSDTLKSLKRITNPELEAYQNSVSSSEFTLYDGAFSQTFTNGDKLSASAINSYVKCPMQYYFSSVLKLSQPEDVTEGFDAAGRGSLIHLCLELFVQAIKGNETKDKKTLYDFMLDISHKAFNHKETQESIGRDKDGASKANINHQIDLKILQKGLENIDATQKSELAKFIDYYIEHEFEFFKNSEPEEFFMLDSEFKPIDLQGLDPKKEADREALKKLDNDKRFIKGFIDRLDNLSEMVHIIDYKSSLGSYSQKDFYLDQETQKLKNFQLGIYMLYARQKYPDKRYNAHLLSFKDEKPNDRISLKHNIDPAKDKYDDNYEKAMKEQILQIQDSINSGNFTFNNTDEKTCEYCNYKYICHQASLNKEVSNA